MANGQKPPDYKGQPRNMDGTFAEGRQNGSSEFSSNGGQNLASQFDTGFMNTNEGKRPPSTTNRIKFLTGL